MTTADGQTRPAAAWVGTGGRARKLAGAAVTATPSPVGAVVCVQAKGMKEPWCLAASPADATAREIIPLDAKRWTIEPSFRDTKDLRFGLGFSAVRLADPQRRDRLLLLNAFGAFLDPARGGRRTPGPGPSSQGQHRQAEAHSLFRQGCMLYDLIPTMPDSRLQPLLAHFTELMQQKAMLSMTFSIA